VKWLDVGESRTAVPWVVSSSTDTDRVRITPAGSISALTLVSTASR
jgi:hypothetical protein